MRGIQCMARLHVHVHFHVCLPNLSHSRGVQVLFRMFSVSRGCDLKVNLIIQHTNRNGFLLCQKKGTNSDFWVPTWARVPRIRPNKSGRSSSTRSRILSQPPLPEGEQSWRRLPFSCFHFCGLLCCSCCDKMANHAGSYCYWGEGTANISADIIRWCVLNAELQKISSF